MSVMSLTFAFPAYSASKKGATVYVKLSPAGSFEIKSKIKGRINYKNGVYKGKNISATVKSFKTGLDLRDKHTKKKMEFKKFPKILIKKATGKNNKGTATIQIKGISKNITFTFKEAGKYLEAKFNLSLKDFKFKGIKYLGVGVKDQVKVLAVIPLKK